MEQLLARPILEQRTRRSRLQGAHDVAVGIVGREELDLDGRFGGLDPLDGGDAVESRHAQIHQDHIGVRLRTRRPLTLTRR